MADQAAIAPTPKEKPAVRPGLKLALEFGPLLAFFFANARGEWLSERVGFLGALGEPIFVATAVFMVATIISLSLSWLLTRTIPIMPLVAGVVVLIFGALTLWFRDPRFLQMKPMIVVSPPRTMLGATLRIVMRAGIEGAVAPLGTAITEEQLRLMWRVSPEPVIALEAMRRGSGRRCGSSTSRCR